MHLPEKNQTTLALCSILLTACAMGQEGPRDTGVVVRDTGVLMDRPNPTGDTGVVGRPDTGVGGMEAGPDCMDADGDGFGTGPGCRGMDCNDGNATAFPGAMEVCDGVDNNCNRMIDEDQGQTMCGMGVCLRMVDNCVMGMRQMCMPGPMAAETCNGQDDDCDGVVDNGVGATPCYSGPMGTMGVGTCRAGSRGCPGGMMGACMGEVLPAMETCNGLDDNCNGMSDEGLSSTCYSGPMGTQDRGRCRSGMRTCVGGMMSACSGEVLPTGETCNNIDDDCNGVVDDAIAPVACYSGPPGTMGVGRCRAGMRVCSGGMITACTGEVLPLGAETCNNMVDDNCNGIVDEGCGGCSPPANERCNAASPLAVGAMASGDTTCAMNDHMGSCAGAGNDAVYSVAVDGASSNISFTANATWDVSVHIHSAPACVGGDEVACNDTDGVATRATAVLNNAPAGTYYVVVDGAAGAAGAFTLNATRTVVNNDTCATAPTITRNGRYIGTTIGQGSNYTGSCGSGTGTTEDVVYLLRSPVARSVTVDTCGSAHDTVLYVGTSCGGTQTGCNDDTCGLGSSVTFNAAANTTYYITIDGYNGATGAYTLNVTGL